MVFLYLQLRDVITSFSHAFPKLTWTRNLLFCVIPIKNLESSHFVKHTLKNAILLYYDQIKIWLIPVKISYKVIETVTGVTIS